MELEVKLSRNGWHYKLQGWALGSMRPELFSLCPYFWLTIFCIISSPVIMVIKPIRKLTSDIRAWNAEREEEHVNRIIKDLTVSTALYLLNSKQTIQGKKYQYTWDLWDLIRRWQSTYNKSDEDTEKFYNEISSNYYDAREQADADKELIKGLNKIKKQEISKKLHLASIVKYTKMFCGLAVSILIVFVLYKCVVGVSHVDWSKVGAAFARLVSTLLVSGIFVLIMLGFVRATSNVDKYYKNKEKLKWYAVPFYLLYNLVKWPVVGLWSFLSFIGSYFSATKDNYCPGIIWDDEKNESNKTAE